jgi:hypothetical protein
LRLLEIIAFKPGTLTMLYVMIGLVCSAVGCEWVSTDEPTFETEKACLERATYIRPRTAMYFELKCKPAVGAAGS